MALTKIPIVILLSNCTPLGILAARDQSMVDFSVTEVGENTSRFHLPGWAQQQSTTQTGSLKLESKGFSKLSLTQLVKEKDADNIRKVLVNHSFSCFENLICVNPQQIQDNTRSVNPIEIRDPPTSSPSHLSLPKELDKFKTLSWSE